MSPQGLHPDQLMEYNPSLLQGTLPGSRESQSPSKSVGRAQYASVREDLRAKPSKARYNTRSASRQVGQRMRQTLKSSASAGNLNHSRHLAATMTLNAQPTYPPNMPKRGLSYSALGYGSSSKHNLATSNTTSRYNATIDPAKKSIIHNHMSHKSKLN